MGSAFEEMEKTVQEIKTGFFEFNMRAEAAAFRRRLVANTLLQAERESTEQLRDTLIRRTILRQNGIIFDEST